MTSWENQDTSYNFQLLAFFQTVSAMDEVAWREYVLLCLYHIVIVKPYATVVSEVKVQESRDKVNHMLSQVTDRLSAPLAQGPRRAAILTTTTRYDSSTHRWTSK